MNRFITFLTITIICFTQCNTNNHKRSNIIFSHNSILPYGTSISCIIDNPSKSIDSVVFTIDNLTFSLPYTKTNSYTIPTKDFTLGVKNILTTIYSEGAKEIHTHTITIVSDIEPVYPSYVIKNTYNHDIVAYTQGLEFDGDSLYESTGLKGESTLRLTDYKSGKVDKSISIAPEYFGEGITILHDRIYQITWQSNVGFIYDKESFRQIGTFSYATEGWGLCNDGKNLIMSDGTEYLYTYDPETFSLIKKIAVYDNHVPISQLNELEYVNGYIYANIYTTNFIVKIEANTGKVVERINLSNILDPKYYHKDMDVLNGIAWKKGTNTLYVTGKKWPKMFEIELTDSTKTQKPI